jgi:L-asparaginase/Glu-tRNA(Gln) amidotransferase subunit D
MEIEHPYRPLPAVVKLTAVAGESLVVNHQDSINSPSTAGERRTDSRGRARFPRVDVLATGGTIASVPDRGRPGVTPLVASRT